MISCPFWPHSGIQVWTSWLSRAIQLDSRACSKKWYIFAKLNEALFCTRLLQTKQACTAAKNVGQFIAAHPVSQKSSKEEEKCRLGQHARQARQHMQRLGRSLHINAEHGVG